MALAEKEEEEEEKNEGLFYFLEKPTLEEEGKTSSKMSLFLASRIIMGRPKEKRRRSPFILIRYDSFPRTNIT